MADAWGGAWGGAWGTSWDIRVPVHTITDTDIIQKPVDYALADKQLIKDRYREWDIRPMNVRTKPGGTRTAGARRLGGDKPSFSVTTTKKGYD